MIGAKAIHLQEKEEREQVPKIENLYIDIGAKDKTEAMKVVQIGDYCVFGTQYTEFGDDYVCAKALDDRLGCACMMELAGENFPCDLYLVFTVQEEVGLRGARVASERIKPDIAIVLEGTTCSDVYGTDPKDYSTVSGNGAALSIIDRSTYYDRTLLSSLCEIAKNTVSLFNLSRRQREAMTQGNPFIFRRCENCCNFCTGKIYPFALICYQEIGL